MGKKYSKLEKQEIKQSVFADNMTLYTKSPKDATHTHKTLRTNSKFGKVAG